MTIWEQLTMATYVVGDLQGCFEPLQRLLDQAKFDPKQDNIWFAGDLVNRGPDNLRVLRFIKGLGSSAIAILGNHDLHLLATAASIRKPSRKDTIQDVLAAPDREELLLWLRQRPLMHKLELEQDTYVMSHAGIPHIWSSAEAFSYAKEVEALLAGDQSLDFFSNMYGDSPNRWTEQLQGWDRLRVITNYLTRMRLIDGNGRLDFDCKGSEDTSSDAMKPWYSFPRKPQDSNVTFLFGHWAALNGVTGHNHYIALDTGCVWGGKLTMMRIEDHKLFQVNSNPFQ